MEKPALFVTHVLALCLLVALFLCFPASPACAADPPAPPLGLTITNGVLLHKVFTNLSGILVADLTNFQRFPCQPDLVDYVSQFETPVNSGDYYGAMLLGFLTPLVTGDYLFYLSSDDQGALFLSTNASPMYKQLIAWEPQWNGLREWTNSVNQSSRGSPPMNVSQPIHLEAGGTYYVEAWLKEGSGGDHLSVAWQMPGGSPPDTGSSPIPSNYLSAPLLNGLAVFLSPPQDKTVIELRPATFSAELAAIPPVALQWLKNGALFVNATNGVLALPSVALVDDGAEFRLVASNAWGSVTSSPALLAVLPKTNAPVLVGVRNLTLEELEVTFSEPITSATATNLTNYAIAGTNGTVTISNAVLATDGQRVVLTMIRLMEGAQYQITLNGIRDTSVAGNLIAPNTQTNFLPYFPDEFVGPFASWGNVRRDYGAVGDGVADDTAALQRALDNLGTDFRDFTGNNNSYVLYLPAGKYRITQGLSVVARPAVSIMGEDPATTTIQWDGATNGVMLSLNGFTLSRLGRLTFDGASRALSAVDQKWDGAGGGGCAPTGNEYADMVLKDVQFGIRGGNWNYQANDAEVAVLRCRFLRCSKAGVSMESFNAMDWFVWYSLFEDCNLGVCNTYGAGAAHVQESVFRRSTDADIAIGNSGYFFIYQNYSLGSRAFFRTGFNGVNEVATLQGNTIIDPQEMPIFGHIMGPLLLIDNVIRSRAAATGPVAEAGHDASFQGDLVSIGNTFTVTNALRVTGRLFALDDVVVDREAVNLPEPELPGTLPNLHRPVLEVPIEADATAIQQAIDAAALLNGQRPVVHLTGRNYWINRSLVIPAGCDLQLVGDSYHYGTTLWWTGTNTSTMLRLASPSRATLRDFRIRINVTSAQAAGISIDGCDQPGARIFGEQVKTDGLLADRLDHARVELRDFYANYSQKQQIAVRVIGGPLKASGQGSEGRVNIFSGAAGYGGRVFDLLNGGESLVRDMYYEGRPQQFMRLSGSGTFTLHSGRCHVDPVANPVIEFKDFYGQASLVNLELNNANIQIVGGGGDTRVLGLGLASTLPDAFVNDSPNAQAALLSSRTGYNGVPQVSVPNYTNQVSSVPEFVRQMLAQTRSERPQKLSRLLDGVTDVRIYRVTAEGGSVGIQLNRDQQATIITQPQSQAALELHSATFAVTPAGPVPYSLQWFRNGDAIPGATNFTYAIPSVALSDDGTVFSVTVSNEWNSVISSNAALTVTADTAPPQAVLAASYDPGWIVASFDEGLAPTSVADTNHYNLSGGAIVTGAFLRPDGKSVLLRVSGPLETNFTLAVSNLLDQAIAHNASSLIITGRVMELTGVDIGNAGDPLEPGSSQTLPDGTIEVIAGGTDIWNAADGCHFSYQPRVGDFDVRVQVSRLDAINAWSKAGLMVRESLTPNSPQLSVLVTSAGPTADGGQGANTYQANWRVARDAPTVEWVGTGSSAGVSYPNAWIRLRRDGNIFTAYRGTDGVNWTLFARMNLDALDAPLPEKIFLGLATTSHNNNSNQTTIAHYQNFGRVDLPPVFNSLAGAITTRVGAALVFSMAATAPDAPWKTLAYSMEPGSPAGAALDPISGLFTWRPSEAQAESTNIVTVQVNDDGSPSLSATQSITILVFNHAPVIASVTPQVAQQNQPYAYQLEVSDVELDTLTWSVMDGPPGLQVEPASGLLTWTPDTNLAAGDYFVRVRVTDDGQPAKSGEMTLSIRLQSADTLAEIQLDLSVYAANTIIESNRLGPDWFNTRGRVVLATAWATNAYQMVCWEGDAQNIPFFLQSQRLSRDQEVDFWTKRGVVFLRLTGDGTAIAFSWNLWGDGSLSIATVRGVNAAAGGDWGGEPVYGLYATNNLAAMILGYRETPTDGDYLTVGVEGFDIYAKYNGREFLRFKDYRYVKAGAVALRQTGEYGIRTTAVRFKADKPLFSDPAAGMLDLRDFGLRSVQVTGSIEAGSTQLVLNASLETPFKPGDWIIVETGAETGRGLRGTVGVGGVWPKLHYATPQARDADTSQPNNTYCWIETDGGVRQWDGSAWQDRAHFLSDTNVVEDFYVAKAMPKALRAAVIQVVSNGLTLMLDEPAQASVTNAMVHFDNAPVLNLLAWQPFGYVPTNFTLIIPPGDYAQGDPLWLRHTPGCGIRGAGTNLTRLFSPLGTPPASICISYSSNAFVESLHLHGNDRDGGCGLAWYNQRGSGEGGVTETQSDAAAGRGGVQLLDACDSDRVSDVLISDVPSSPWEGALSVINSSEVVIERVRIQKKMPARGPGAMVKLGGCRRLSANSLQVLSDRLAQGLIAENLEDVDFHQIQGRNVIFKFTDIRGNVTIRDSQFDFEPMAQEGQSDYWAPVSTWWDSILQFSFNEDWGRQILVENVAMVQGGYLNRRQDLLRGITCWTTSHSLRVIGGSYSSPDYLPGTGGNAGIGINTDAASAWVESFRVSGIANGDNLYVSHGTITNCWADSIRKLPGNVITNCWADRNLAPIIGQIFNNPGACITNSNPLGVVGNPVEPGCTLITNGTVQLVAGGKNEENLDAGRFAWTQISGDFDCSVRVFRLEDRAAYMRAGIMVRRSLSANATEAEIHIPNRDGIETWDRFAENDGINKYCGGIYYQMQDYVWLRLLKVGNHITTFYSPAHGWIWITNACLDLPNVNDPSSNSTFLGLFATSDDNTPGQTMQAVFSEFRLTRLLASPVIIGMEGKPFHFSVPAHDFNWPVQKLTWTLGPGAPAGAALDADTGEFTWFPGELEGPSTNLIQVAVADDGIPSLSVTQTYALVIDESNTAPALAFIATQYAVANKPFLLQINATDADLPANQLTFSLTGSVPSGAAITSAGLLTWTPAVAYGATTNLLEVVVRDDGAPSQSATQSFSVVVYVPPAVSVHPSSQIVQLGSNLILNASASGFPTPDYQWFMDDFAILNATNSSFILYPTSLGDAGVYFCIVSNAAGVATSAVTVIIVNRPPMPVAPVLERWGGIGVKAKTANFLGTDPDGDGLALALLGLPGIPSASVTNLGAWVRYRPASGNTNDDSFPFTISDGRGGFASNTAVVRVVADPAPSQNLTRDDLGDRRTGLCFEGIPGRTYAIQFAENLANPSWQTLTNLPADAVGAIRYVDTPPQGAQPRYYRTLIQLP